MEIVCFIISLLLIASLHTQVKSCYCLDGNNDEGTIPHVDSYLFGENDFSVELNVTVQSILLTPFYFFSKKIRCVWREASLVRNNAESDYYNDYRIQIDKLLYTEI